MPGTKHRVIIDTNLWISFLLTKDFGKFDPILFGDNIEVLFSPELLDEFIEVAQRPKFKKYFSLADLQQLLEQISRRSTFVNVTTTVQICRDVKDNFLLSLATDGKATHLLTGDKDLLVLKKFGSTAILEMSDYLSLM